MSMIEDLEREPDEDFYRFSCFIDEIQSGEVVIEKERYSIIGRTELAKEKEILCSWCGLDIMFPPPRVGAIWFLDPTVRKGRGLISLHWGAKFCGICHQQSMFLESWLRIGCDAMRLHTEVDALRKKPGVVDLGLIPEGYGVRLPVQYRKENTEWFTAQELEDKKENVAANWELPYEVLFDTSRHEGWEFLYEDLHGTEWKGRQEGRGTTAAGRTDTP